MIDLGKYPWKGEMSTVRLMKGQRTGKVFVAFAVVLRSGKGKTCNQNKRNDLNMSTSSKEPPSAEVEDPIVDRPSRLMCTNDLEEQGKSLGGRGRGVEPVYGPS